MTEHNENKPFFPPKCQQKPLKNKAFRYGTICTPCFYWIPYSIHAENKQSCGDRPIWPLKNGDAETSPFPKLPLEKELRIVYNHHRSNQRIFALSDDCHRKLINRVYELHRLLPIAVGGSQFTFYGDCRDMIKLQK